MHQRPLGDGNRVWLVRDGGARGMRLVAAREDTGGGWGLEKRMHLLLQVELV